MNEWIDKASHLIEALPYIRRFSGKIFVVKCGGAAMTEAPHMEKMMQDIALLYFCGICPVIIHGGGKEISTLCERLEIPTTFINGHRVTDAPAMEVVQMVLFGKTNRALVTTMNQLGVKAVGLTGQDAAFLHAKKMHLETKDTNLDYGFTGDVTKVEPALINTLLENNYLPIIAPIGVDEEGQAYNINADIVAGAIAGAMGAEKLIILSDVNGLYADAADPSTRLNSVKKDTIKQWLDNHTVSGGMYPKLQSCIHALEQGVPSVHILDGKMPHSLLLEIFTDQGIGTLIYNQ